MADLKDDLNKIVNDGDDITFRFEPEDIDKNKWVCALSYLFILFFLPLVICPTSKYGRFHANQSLVLLIITAIGNIAFRIAGNILSVLHLRWIATLGGSMWALVVLAFMVLGIVNVLGGKARQLPVIGWITLIK